MTGPKDDWQTHVRLEITDATFDSNRLLDITNNLVDMEEADLIPDHIADDLFSLIRIHNEGEVK
jgi:hypothetical protein